MVEQNSQPTAAEIHCPIVVSPLFPRKMLPQTQYGPGAKDAHTGVHAQLLGLAA